jgi:hypothetical protein
MKPQTKRLYHAWDEMTTGDSVQCYPFIALEGPNLQHLLIPADTPLETEQNNSHRPAVTLVKLEKSFLVTTDPESRLLPMPVTEHRLIAPETCFRLYWTGPMTMDLLHETFFTLEKVILTILPADLTSLVIDYLSDFYAPSDCAFHSNGTWFVAKRRNVEQTTTLFQLIWRQGHITVAFPPEAHCLIQVFKLAPHMDPHDSTFLQTHYVCQSKK